MFISYTYKRSNGNTETRKYKCLSIGQKLTNRACYKVAHYAKQRSGIYLIDRQGRVRESR